MFPLAFAVILAGLFLFLFWGLSPANPGYVDVPCWVAGVGTFLMLAGIVIGLFAIGDWVGWGVPTWLIWGAGIVGVVILAVSWAGTFGDSLARSPIESYPFLVIIGSGILAGAVVAGIAR